MAQEEVSAAGCLDRVCQSSGTSTDRTRASKWENKEHLAHAVFQLCFQGFGVEGNVSGSVRVALG